MKKSIKMLLALAICIVMPIAYAMNHGISHDDMSSAEKSGAQREAWITQYNQMLDEHLRFDLAVRKLNYMLGIHDQQAVDLLRSIEQLHGESSQDGDDMSAHMAHHEMVEGHSKEHDAIIQIIELIENYPL